MAPHRPVVGQSGSGTGPVAGARGSPARRTFLVGVDLGGTNVRAAAVTAAGEIGPVRKVPTLAHEGREAVLDRIADLVRSVASEAGGRLRAVGVGIPGPIDFATRSVVDPPNLPGWGTVPVGPLLEERLGVPVAVENDANAVVLGEALHGAGRGARIVLGFTLGTGVGGGLVVDGRVHRGATGTGGEVGHMVLHPGGRRCGCGRRGCLEAYASATAVVARARAARRRHPDSALASTDAAALTAREVTRAARAGDVLAARILEETGHDLGVGVGSAVSLVDPDVVVLAGGLTAAGRWLLPAVRRAVRQTAFGRASGVRVVKHRLGDRAGILGAAATAHGHAEAR